MGLITLGTAHVFGVAGTMTLASVQSFNVTEDHQNKTNTLDESGNEVERRRDDLMSSGSIVIRIQTGITLPAAGDVLTYDTVEYEVDTVDRAETNNAHVVVTLSIKTSENVDLSP